MEDNFRRRLSENLFNYRESLNRIIDRYSKLQSHGEDFEVDVDLNDVDSPTLNKHFKNLKNKMGQVESESSTTLSEEYHRAGSSTALNLTRDTRQLDLTCQDGAADVSAESISQFPVRDNEITRNDMTVSSLDESSRNFSEVGLQPEDEDEELQMSLNSHSNFMVELYPCMMTKLGMACHRQHVSKVGDAVLKRYRKWRLHPKRGNLNKTFVAPVIPNNSHTRKMNHERERNSSSVKRPLLKMETDRCSPLKMETCLHDHPAQQQFSGKAGGSPRKVQQRTTFVLDLDSSDNSEEEKSLNKTFNVYELSPTKRSHLRERHTYKTSFYYPTQKATVTPSLQLKRLSSSAPSAGCSVYSPKTSAVRARPDICGSPVRHSPSNMRVASQGPLPAYYSPRRHSVDDDAREPAGPRLFSARVSPSRRPAVPLLRQSPRSSPRSFRPELRSPQSVAATSAPYRLQRYLSLDSLLTSVRSSFSDQQLDAELIRAYHTYVCQRKSSFSDSLRCHQCVQRASDSRVHSSSMLSALALSPHCHRQRKRLREKSGSGSPSKRSREEYGTYSPGSSRGRNEMLRRRLCPEEFERPRGGLPSSPSKQGASHQFATQRLLVHRDSSMMTHLRIPAYGEPRLAYCNNQPSF